MSTNVTNVRCRCGHDWPQHAKSQCRQCGCRVFMPLRRTPEPTFSSPAIGLASLDHFLSLQPADRKTAEWTPADAIILGLSFAALAAIVAYLIAAR